MPTPAEIIAARYAEPKEEIPVKTVEKPSHNGEKASTSNPSSKSSSTPSIQDDGAFPVLGGKSNVGTTPSWGPSIKSSTESAVDSGYMKSSTIQEAFSLDADDQHNFSRPEFVKLVMAIRNETKTNVECTISQHTKKRTFLITGRPEDVKQAKKLVIRRLTRPVCLEFTVPAKLRSRIIGPQGRVLKPIISENAVKIDIGNTVSSQAPEGDEEGDEEEDEFASTVVVTIEGDAEGCNRAKAQILAIVKEETKNLSIRVPIDPLVKPFASKALSKLDFGDVEVIVPDFKSSSQSVLITGDREQVLYIKKQVIDILNDTQSKIIVHEVDIPQVKRQFLPVDEILYTYDVLIKSSNQGPVQFIGSKAAIAEAQEFARKTTSQYKVEVLEMAKAHKGNIDHVKAVALYLSQTGVFKKIAQDNGIVINSPKKAQLIESTSVPIEIIDNGQHVEACKAARKSIVNVVNKIIPATTRVIDDIDSFLIARVPQTIDDLCKQQNVDYVILGNRITLFEKENEDQDDFTESESQLDIVANALQPLRELGSSLETVTIKASKIEQASLQNKTIKCILDEVEENTVCVSYKDQKIEIHGLKKQVEAVEKEIKAALSELKEFGINYTGTITVPAFILPRLIGKNGQNLRTYKEDFDVKIEVPDVNQSEDKNAKVEVIVVGIKRNVDHALVKIQEFVKRWADETTTRLRIEEQYHRKIIGANGIFINRLQDKYHVKIRFPSVNGEIQGSHPDSPRSKDEVVIKGPSRGVARAEEELRELAAFERENGFKQVIKIPTAAISHVIGKQGETIRDISDGTGVEYHFSRDGNEEQNGFIELELTGSKNALKQAADKIKTIVDEVERFVTVTLEVPQELHRHLIGPGGRIKREIIKKAGGEDVAREKYHRLLTIPNANDGSTTVTSSGDKEIVDKIIEQVKNIVAKQEATIKKSIDIPKEKHRFIIGQQGSIRQELQNEYDVLIEVPRESSPSISINLEGLPEQIDKLISKIEQLTKDDWSEELEVPQRYHALVSERGAVIGWLNSQFNVEVSHGPAASLATELSQTKIPTPPEEAAGEDRKFTIIDGVTLSEGDKMIPWRIKGKNEKAKKAKDFLELRLKRAKEADKTAWFWVENPSSLSKLIGPRGQTLNSIRDKSGTFITAPRAGDKFDQFVYLIGTEAGLRVAEKEFAKRK